ncbi:hypothetical protein [Salinicoccus halodurans]|uniref:Uncharacterized protein n=1 Tax=Salinicoccus halodurans TaxID=407035 RepID=A0A0F7HJ13_9STAP|nr:hypothetical protein [Salinicoccus halodurans]AKG73042.1 hypothetical protein AAT16_01670 [Salinicoccus halodurans]SFK77946.1 hypothetical protein SAMN05216235_1708 [Salinicoccus halodurans]
MKRITLMEAYAIETLRSNAYKNEEIIEKVRNNEIEDFKAVDDHMDYDGLFELEAEDFLGNILEKGYQVKFLTINGLTNLIRMKYGKEADSDYRLSGFVVSELQLEAEERRDLETMLSSNWKFSESENGITIAPAK